jgi:hypothetical protein
VPQLAPQKPDISILSVGILAEVGGPPQRDRAAVTLRKLLVGRIYSARQKKARHPGAADPASEPDAAAQ